MPLQIRKKKDIFHIDQEWFSGYWHFSFGEYYDPKNINFGNLRVFNVDTLAPGAVWPLHPHKDIEVVTYCVDGQFQHADNLGNNGILYKGDVQHTTVGKGLWHSEINHSKDKPMTFIQVWIMPNKLGLKPSLEQRHVKPEERFNKFLPLVSNKHKNALRIEQDSEVYSAVVEPGIILSHSLNSGYGAYVYVIEGEVNLNNKSMFSGDAAKVRKEKTLIVKGIKRSEIFLVVVKLTNP